MSAVLHIIRHGERVDEVDKEYWRKCVKKDKSGRSKSSLHNDPPLTKLGERMAHAAAASCQKLLNGQEIECVYASKLVRSAQTGYFLAKLLGIPLVLCSGLGRTTEGYRNIGSSFEFLTVNDFSQFFPKVEVVDGDSTCSQFFVPAGTNTFDWLSPLLHITSRHPLSVVVAHRETIRYLHGQNCNTPYCCIGTFERCETAPEISDFTPCTNKSKTAQYDIASGQYLAKHVVDMNGEVVKEKEERLEKG